MTKVSILMPVYKVEKYLRQKELNLLLYNPEKFAQKIESKLLISKLNNIRNNLFSLRVNFARICVRLFGVKLLEISECN